MNQKIIASTLDSLLRLLSDLQVDAQETTMLRAIIALNAETHGLSHSAVQDVNQLRDRVHSALYQHCTDVCPDKAAIRFAKLLHVLPKVSVSSCSRFGDLVHWIVTFSCSRGTWLNTFEWSTRSTSTRRPLIPSSTSSLGTSSKKNERVPWSRYRRRRASNASKRRKH